MATPTISAPPAPPPPSQCFVKLNNTITSPPAWSACGTTNSTAPFVSCCQNGDYCLENGLCRYTHSQNGGSGFYVAGCTDAQYNSGTCPQLCNSLGVKDAVFNQNPSRLWKCCGASPDGTPHCDKPTDENFDAPQPQRLETYYQASVGTVATATGTRRQSEAESSTPSPTPTSSRPPPPSPPKTVTITSAGSVFATEAASTSSSKLSAGAAGGIGAGAGVALILIILLLFLLFRRKKKRQHTAPPTGSQPEDIIEPRRYDSAGRDSSGHVASPWTAGGGHFDMKEGTMMPRPPTELHAEHALEMPGDGLISPVNTRDVRYEMSTDSMRKFGRVI